MDEQWKDIEGYEDLYQISTKGRVKSLQREYSVNGGLYLRKERIMKQSVVMGYRCVTLSKKGVKRTCKVHRIVANAFIPRIKNFNIVNHKDEDKFNNNVENLEWCSYKYNTNYGTNRVRISKTKRDKGQAKSVDMYDKSGNFIRHFDSIVDAANYIGARKTDVCSVCNGRQQSTKGYKFKYTQYD